MKEEKIVRKENNPVESKGMGEAGIVDFAAAVTNTVYNTSGKRIRELPVTPDRLI
jgi:xanthine dehydrogenase YagR molybdenum-binding subunit